MSDFDDFRSDFDDDDDLDNSPPVDIDALVAAQNEATRKPFLGMKASERAFLSLMIFLNVAVLGVGLLIATGRIVF